MQLLTNGTLNVRAIFTPRSYAPALTERGSTATMVCGDEAPEILDGDWVRDETEPAAGTIWRVKSREEDRVSGRITYTMEHIVRTLEDIILPGEYGPGNIVSGASSVTARQAAAWAIGFHPLWQLGDCPFDASAPYNFNRETVFDALETITEAQEGAVWEYDLTGIPFTLHLRTEDPAAGCEMRWGRNLTGLRIRTDRSKMYTRIWPIGKDDMVPPGGYFSRNEEFYGRIDHTETDTSIDSQALLESWARGKLAHHCEPILTVTGSGLEISRATGEPLDQLQLNRVCRIPEPETGNIIQARITKVQWADKIQKPDVVTLTLSNEEEDVARIVNRITKSTGKGGRAGAKEAKEDHAWFVDTEDHVAMVAESIIGRDPVTGEVDWSRVSSIIVDGTGIHQAVVAAQGELVTQSARIDVNENAITQEVTDRTNADGEIRTTITTTASGLRAEFMDEIDGVEATITATASQLRTEYQSADGLLQTSITQTNDAITAEVTRATGAEGTLSGRIQVNADAITAEVTRATGTESSLSGRIQVNADRVALVVKQENGQDVIKAAEITAAINAAGGTEAWINAENVWIGDKSKYADGVFDDYDVVIAGKASISDLTAATARISSLEADFADLDILKANIASIASLNVQSISSNRGAASFYTIEATSTLNVGGVNCSALPNGVKAVQIVETSSGSGIYKLQYTTYASPSTWTDAGTFSRAASLTYTGAWSGNNTGDTATYAVTESQNSTTIISSWVKLHINRNAAWVTDPAGTIRARLDNDYYDLGEAAGETAGWNAAYGKVSLPKTAQTTNAFIDIQTPSSVAGTADPDNTRYTVSVDSSAAYIKWGGVTVAQVSHTQYSSGQSNGWSLAEGKNLIPESTNTGPSMTVKWPSATYGQQVSHAYTISVDDNYAYLTWTNSSGTPVTVARCDNATTDAQISITGPGWSTSRPSSGTAMADTSIQSATNGYLTYTVTARGRSKAFYSHFTYTTTATYAAGWADAYSKVSLPKTAQTTNAFIDIGTPSSVSGTAAADNTRYTVSADNSYAYIKWGSTTVARAANPAWGNAAAKNVIPESTNTGSSMTVKWPSSTAGQQISHAYTISADNNYAYLTWTNASGTAITVARCSNATTDAQISITGPGWSATKPSSGTQMSGTGIQGATSGYLTYTVTARGHSKAFYSYFTYTGGSGGGSFSEGWAAAYGKVSLPKTAQTANAFIDIGTPNSTAGTEASDNTRYTVSTDENYAYIKWGGTTVARCANTKVGSLDKYYNSVYWASATAANKWKAKIPNVTNTGSEDWDCGARSAYNAGGQTAFIGISSGEAISGTKDLSFGESLALWPGAKNVDGTTVWPYASSRKLTVTAPSLAASSWSCSKSVESIGTDYGSRMYCGAISKSGLIARTYLGFTIKVAGATRNCYITVNS